MSGIHIACTAIHKRINAGRINKAGDSFIGDPKDVTSECLKAVVDLVGVGKSRIVTEDGKMKYEIEVRLILEEK